MFTRVIVLKCIIFRKLNYVIPYLNSTKLVFIYRYNTFHRKWLDAIFCSWIKLHFHIKYINGIPFVKWSGRRKFEFNDRQSYFIIMLRKWVYPTTINGRTLNVFMFQDLTHLLSCFIRFYNCAIVTRRVWSFFAITHVVEYDEDEKNITLDNNTKWK